MRSAISKPRELRGFSASIPLEVLDVELGTALHDQAHRLALKTLPVLAAFFSALVFFRVINLLEAGGPEIQLATTAAAIVLTLVAIAVDRRIFLPHRVNFAIALAATVAIVHALVEMNLTRQVDATIYLIVLLPSLAATILSWHGFLSACSIALGGWGLLAWLVMPASEWELVKTLGGALAASTMLAVVLLRFRLKAYRSRLNDELIAVKRTRSYEQVQSRYESAVRGANDGLWYWDLENNTLAVSSRWLEMIGCELDSFTIEPDFWFERVDPYYLPALEAAISSHLEGETDQLEYKYRMRNAAGTPFWVLTRGVASRDSEGRAVSMAGSLTNIEHVIEVEQRLVQDALEDKLTGLSNRHHLMSHLEVVTSRSKSRDEEIGLIFIDLDDFKLVNDSLGHPMGDRLLADVAARLRQCQRPGDLLARYGGDEFVFLLENLSSPKEPERYCEMIQRVLLEPFRLGEHELSLTASMGVCIGRAGIDRHDDLIRNADIAMYAAKSTGKGQVHTYHSEMFGETLRSWNLQNEVKDVVGNESYWLEYQPIVSGDSGLVVAAEALFRFKPRNDRSPSVEEFIRTAENIDLISKIGAWVLKEACTAAVGWQRPGCQEIPVSVNVSAHQLVLPDFPDTVARALKETGLPSSCLELEVTETALITNLEAAKSTLDTIAATGVRISIDDFGTGYSSLHHLGNFPFVTVKIDRSFISNLVNDVQARALAVGIISMAHGLGMKVTAEGVESIDQLAYLTSLNCDRIQGYLASRAIPESEFLEVLARDRNGFSLLSIGPGQSTDQDSSKKPDSLEQQLPILQQALLSAGDFHSTSPGSTRHSKWEGLFPVSTRGPMPPRNSKAVAVSSKEPSPSGGTYR